MELWDEKFILDNVTGRVVNSQVKRVGDVFQFTVDRSRPITTDEIKSPRKDSYLEFSRLFRKAEKLAGKKKTTETLFALFEKELEKLAQENGPLFGFGGLCEDAPIINEPIADWAAAQQVMDRILQIDVCVERKEIPYNAVKNYFPILISSDMEGMIWEFHFAPQIAPPELYRSFLREEVNQWFTSNDSSALHALWTNGDDQPN